MGKRKTHEEFIEELKIKNPSFLEEYEFVTEYYGSNDKIIVKDKYGEIYMLPDAITKGRKPIIKNALNPTQYFMNKLKIVNPEIYRKIIPLTEFEGTDHHMVFKAKYGKVRLFPASLLRGSGFDRQSALDPQEYFINECKDVHNGFYSYENVEFVDLKSAVEIICPKHGNFSQQAQNHVKGHGCRKCYDENRRMTHEEFMADLKIKNIYAYKNLKFKEEYSTTKKALLCEDKYGELRLKPQELLMGVKWNILSAVDKNAYFINQAREKNPYFNDYDYSKIKYKTASEHIEIICKKCNESFYPPVSNHLKGQRCPLCVGWTTELRARDFLIENSIKFTKEKTFKGMVSKKGYALRIDYYLEDYNIALELMGRQHYEAIDFFGGEERLKKQISNDNLKRKYCRDNGIKLIEIPYTKYKNIEDEIRKELNL